MTSRTATLFCISLTLNNLLGCVCRWRHIGGDCINSGVIALADKKDYRYIEKLLYMQKTHCAAIAELQAELADMLPSATASFVRFSHNSGMGELTQPEREAERLLHSTRGKYIQQEIKRRKRQQRAISQAMRTLTTQEAQLVFLRYHLEKRPAECWVAMKTKKSRWYELRAGIIYKIATFLGA